MGDLSPFNSIDCTLYAMQDLPVTSPAAAAAAETLEPWRENNYKDQQLSRPNLYKVFEHNSLVFPVTLTATFYCMDISNRTLKARSHFAKHRQ